MFTFQLPCQKYSYSTTVLNRRHVCRKSNIPSLAEIHGRDRESVEADPIQRRTAGEPVQRPNAAAVPGQAEVTEAVSRRTHENRNPIRSRKSPLADLSIPTRCINKFRESFWTFHEEIPLTFDKINFWEWERKFHLFIWTRWWSMNRHPRAAHRNLWKEHEVMKV